jgi:hypothetical protein
MVLVFLPNADVTKKISGKSFIPINNLLDEVDNLWDVFADTREAIRREHVQGLHILIIVHSRGTGGRGASVNFNSHLPYLLTKLF